MTTEELDWMEEKIQKIEELRKRIAQYDEIVINMQDTVERLSDDDLQKYYDKLCEV